MISAIDVYDYIYAWKEYGGESKKLEIFLEQAGANRGDLLELACGTGKYISHLKDWNCTGVDLCAQSISIAKVNDPSSHFVVSNMKETGLKIRFDVILCLFGGISYLKGDDIDTAIDHWSSLLKDGGVLVIEPWLEEEQIQFGTPFLHIYKSEEIYVSRTVVPKHEHSACVLDFSFLIMQNREPTRRLLQRDILYLHKKKWLLKRFKEHQFIPIFNREGFLRESILWFFRKNE